MGGRIISLIVAIVVVYAGCCISAVKAASPEETAFTTWFAQNGGVINGIDLATFPQMGRGFKAVKDINENEHILHIPHKLIFSTKNMAANVDSRVRKVLDTLGTDAALYAWLLLEKHKSDSFFKPYIDILPKYVSSLVYFDKSELSELHSASLVGEVQDMQASARADYEAFLLAYAQIQKMQNTGFTTDAAISYDEYLWAMSMFNSRGLRFQGPVYMAPMADIFNYRHHHVARSANNGDFFAKHHKLDADGITILSDRAHKISGISDQVQVHEDYGDNSDEIYFKYHGFVPDENPFRCAVVGLDGIVSDLVAASPAKSSAASTDKTLLVGATAAHKALFSVLEFNRLPSKCVTPISRPDGGYFGKGLEVLLIMLSFTEAEAQHCVQYAQSTSGRANSGSRSGAKNWPGIFKECGFSEAEEFLRKVRAEGADAIESAHRDGNNLPARVLRTVQRFLDLSIQRDEMSKGVNEDALLLASLQSQLDADFSVPVLHKYLAVKYRYHRKQLLLSVASQYGAEEGAKTLQGAPSWALEQDGAAVSATDSTGADMAAAAADASLSTAPSAPLPADAPLRDRIRAFNAWFTSLHPEPCHIAAMEIPEYRMGTIATQDIKKGDTYLGISTSHGGIMDSEVALRGPNTAVAALLTQVIAAYPKRDDFHELLFFLLHEAFVLREKSFYWPYISLLPTYEDMENNAFVPLLWPEEDIKPRLGPSDVAGLISDYHAKIRTRYSAILKMKLITDFFPNATDSDAETAANLNVFTFRNYQWATVILDSRAIWWGGKRHLVPMLDFVNCQEHVQDRALLHSTVLDAAGAYAITKSGRDFKAGEQLFENYGQPNHIYFTYHGFLLQNNSHDCVHMDLPLTSEDLKGINLNKAAPILQKLRLSPTKPSLLPVCLTHPVAPMVWAFLAVKGNTFEQLHDQQLLGRENPAGIESLLGILNERLQRYAKFHRSSHSAANRLLDAEAEHLQLVKAALLSDRAKYATEDDADL